MRVFIREFSNMLFTKLDMFMILLCVVDKSCQIWAAYQPIYCVCCYMVPFNHPWKLMILTWQALSCYLFPSNQMLMVCTISPPERRYCRRYDGLNVISFTIVPVDLWNITPKAASILTQHSDTTNLDLSLSGVHKWTGFNILRENF